MPIRAPVVDPQSPPPEAAPFGTQVDERSESKVFREKSADPILRTGVWRSPAPRANEGVRPLRGLSDRSPIDLPEGIRGPRAAGSEGEATSLLDSPRSGRTPSLARGAGERQTPVRQRARAYLETPEALSTSLSVTCVPNGAAPRGCRARGSAVRGPLRGRREAMVGNHCVAVG